MVCRRQQAERFTKAFGCGGEVCYASQGRGICEWPRDERGTGRRESTMRPGLYCPEAWERTATAGEVGGQRGLGGWPWEPSRSCRASGLLELKTWPDPVPPESVANNKTGGFNQD